MTSLEKKCLIIVGGEYAPFREDISFDYVIACDKGFEYADRMGIRYDIVLGDFDSASSTPHSDVPVITLPAEKDDTDTIYAVKYAIEQGYDDIYVSCAFGGRLDHTIANVQTAAFIARQGKMAHFYGTDTELHCFSACSDAVSADDRKVSMTINRREKTHLSVFSLSEKCTGVSILGTKYELKDATITNHFPIGVSNEWKDSAATISIKDGIIAIVLSGQA